VASERSSEAVQSAESDLELMRRIAEASATAICADALAEAAGTTLVIRTAISQADASRRVRAAVAVAASRHDVAMHALKIAVCEFTYALRRDGVTPEGVLVSLKQLIDDRALPRIPPHESDWSGNRLRESISTWCIKAYFDSEGACI
jgi:hypothetical protein